MRELQLLIGSIENYQQSNNIPNFSKAVIELDRQRSLSDAELLKVVKRENSGEINSMISKVVSKRVYEYCSRNDVAVVECIENAVNSYNRRSGVIHDQQLVRYLKKKH